MDSTKLKVIKELLTQAGLRPSKRLGQNFLLSRKVIEKTIRAAELTKQDTVLEIGPGLGGLTFELAKHVKQVIAVERDKRLAELLHENTRQQRLERSDGGQVKASKHENKIKIVNQDILRFTTDDLRLTTYKIVANLPYQITSLVLWKFLHEEKHKPTLMVLMMQKEVAERIIAQPGQMSLLSVLTQYYAEPKIIINVKRTSFYPVPQVDSAIVSLKTKEQREKIKIDEERFLKLVKAGFANKRKMLKNNLNINAQLLAKAGLKENSRAQELAVADWLRLYKLVY